jgi:hypothetical protein
MGGLRLIRKEADFLAPEQVLAETFQRVPLRIMVKCNHWHFVVWLPKGQDDRGATRSHQIAKERHRA